MGENEVKALVKVAAESIFEEVARGIEPLREATRAMQVELVTLRLAICQLAAIVAERVPEGPALLHVWVRRCIATAENTSLNDEKAQSLPPEIESQVRAEIREKFEALAASIVVARPD